MTHICARELTIIGSDNGLSPGRRQAIIWTNARILLIGPVGNKLQWNLKRNLYIFIQEAVFQISSKNWRPFCLGIDVIKVLKCAQWILKSYLGLTRSISWLLMPWLLTSPGHQQQWHWLCRICRSWSYFRKDFKYLSHINVEWWHEI